MAAEVHLWRLVDGGHLSSDAQRDVFVLGVSPVQVAHPLVARLPPEVQEAVSDGVVFKHDVVHVSVFLGRTTAGLMQRSYELQENRQEFGFKLRLTCREHD